MRAHVDAYVSKDMCIGVSMSMCASVCGRMHLFTLVICAQVHLYDGTHTHIDSNRFICPCMHICALMCAWPSLSILSICKHIDTCMHSDISVCIAGDNHICMFLRMYL